jgi:uncharacterized protein DUF2846
MRTTMIVFFMLFRLTSVIAQEDAKRIAPPDGKALVYLLRPSKVGSLVTFTTTCDDKVVGKTKGNRFVYAIIDPGSHTLATTGGEKDAQLSLATEANKIYFIEIVPKMGVIMARVKMEQLTEEEGRKKLEKCKPVPQENTL